MIKKLRWKFIAVAMISIIVVLMAIIGTITLINYNKTVDNIDKVLTVLVDNGGKFNNLDFGDDNLKNTDGNNNKDNLNHQKDQGEFTKETPYWTRFFSVKFTNSNPDPAVDTSMIASVSKEEAIDMAKETIDSNSMIGFYGAYRYKVKIADDFKLVVFVDCTKEMRSIRYFVFTGTWISLVGIIAVFIIVFIFSKIVFNPVKRTYDKQKRFVTNAAHELKTPLTIISANNELIDAQYNSLDETQAIDKQVKKLTIMINNLTLLSKLDEEDKNVDLKEKVDLTKLSNDLIEPFKVIFESRNIKFNFFVDDNCYIKGNTNLISQLLSLLIDNANKYALTYIDFEVRIVGKGVELKTSNDADIDEKNPNLLLERFYRNDKARGKIEGSGIGLSVVNEIVKLHKGTIKLNASNNVYSCVIKFKN